MWLLCVRFVHIGGICNIICSVARYGLRHPRNMDFSHGGSGPSCSMLHLGVYWTLFDRSGFLGHPRYPRPVLGIRTTSWRSLISLRKDPANFACFWRESGAMHTVDTWWIFTGKDFLRFFSWQSLPLKKIKLLFNLFWGDVKMTD